MIVSKPSVTQLSAIARLYNEEDFRTFRSFIENELRAQDTTLRQASGTENIFRRQGAAEFCDSLIRLMDEARSTIDKETRRKGIDVNAQF